MAQLQEQGGTISVIWLDDGGRLHDGFSTNPSITGIRATLPPDWTGDPPTGYCSATGILRCVPNPQGKLVRSLVPRTAADLNQL